MQQSVVPAHTESLRDRILDAAWVEFGDKGFYGARMDEIAKSAGASKQVLYHHFLSKSGLFGAVVNKAYLSIRGSDGALRYSLSKLSPDEALVAIVESLFGTGLESIRFQRLMHDENRFEGIHVREMDNVRVLYQGLVELIGSVLQRGVNDGSFRADVDPAELFASLAGLFMFRLTNRYTLSVVLDLQLDTDEGARQSRLATIQMVLDALRP